MNRIIPTRAEVRLIKETAIKQARRYGAQGRVTLEPGVRVPFANSPLAHVEPNMNIRLVDASPNWEESDLFSHTTFCTFASGFDATPDGRGEIDFYCYDCTGLICNVTAVYAEGKLCRIVCTNEGPDTDLVLWEGPAQA